MREFPSAQLKIDRANHHIGDVDARRKFFLKTNPCKLRPQYNPHTTFTEYMVEDVVEVDPVISLVIGDAIHNLRSALDHLAAALFRENNSGAAPPTTTYFPIYESASKYIAGAPGKVKGISIADQRGIDLQKPYLGGNGTLWGLHRMDITDKHDLILTHTQCVEAINYRFSEAEMVASMGGINFFGREPSTEKNIFSVPLIGQLPIPKKGNILIQFPGDTEKNEDIHPSFDIAFGNVEVFKGRPVLPSLRELANLVQGIVDSFK